MTTLQEHQGNQLQTVHKLIERERWFVSEELGYDCTTTAIGICTLNHRISQIITDGFGEFMETIENTLQTYERILLD